MNANDVYDELKYNWVNAQQINIGTELNYIGRNNIGDEEMNLIITSELTQLKSLYVGKMVYILGWNNITSFGLSAMPEMRLKNWRV